MPDDMSLAKLVALDNRKYAEVVKGYLRDDESWPQLLHPIVAPRTRVSLQGIIQSIDRQIERIGDADPEWRRGASVLRRYANDRLSKMAPEPQGMVPGSKEARAWRAFSARLARALAENDSAALDRIQTPYGGLTAREWLSVREERR